MENGREAHRISRLERALSALSSFSARAAELRFEKKSSVTT
jgi:hypothetical protein